MLIMAVAITGSIAFRPIAGGTITGKINPADGAAQVWAISNNDTLKAAVQSGLFSINGAKPGTYKLLIDAVAPYKDLMKEGVVVREGEVSNLGDIQLEK